MADSGHTAPAAELVARETVEVHGLGFGWLLALALGGGMLIFLALALLLVWIIKQRVLFPVSTRRVYARDKPGPRRPSNWLWKGGYLVSEHSMSLSQMGSRLSVGLPPVLPPLPLPLHHRLSRGRSGSLDAVAGRIGEDEPKAEVPGRRSLRGSWLNEGWWRKLPSMTDLSKAEGGLVAEGDRESGASVTAGSAVATTSLGGEKPPKGDTRTPKSLRAGLLNLYQQVTSPSKGQSSSPTKSDPSSPSKRQPNVLRKKQQPEEKRGVEVQDTQQPQQPEQPADEAKDEASQTIQRIEVHRPHERTMFQRSQTAPALTGKPIRSPSQAHVRTGSKDMYLRDILQSTEKRLSIGGVSQTGSGTTTPLVSPVRMSPKKTPRSGSGSGKTRNYPQPSPSPSRTPRNGAAPAGRMTIRVVSRQSSLTPSTMSKRRTGSVGSIGSAADSLLEEAARSLGSPSTTGSPSRQNLSVRSRGESPQLRDPAGAQQTMRQQQRQQQQLQQQRMQQQKMLHQQKIQEQKQQKRQEEELQRRAKQSAYRQAVQSDASSSLSTLYSANEAEDDDNKQQSQTAKKPEDDPFVDNRSQQSEAEGAAAKEVSPDVKAFRRRTTNIVCTTAEVASPICESACVSPLRPISANVTNGHRRGSALSWLQPPVDRASVDLQREEDADKDADTDSMVSVSVHSLDSQPAELPAELPAEEVKLPTEVESMPETPKRKQIEAGLSSSPYNEEDILDLLLSSVGPKRALPYPPIMGDGFHPTTQLSPRPRNGSSRGVLTRSSSSAAGYPTPFDSQHLTPRNMQRNQVVSGMSNATDMSCSVATSILDLRRTSSSRSAASTLLGERGTSQTMPNLHGFSSGSASPRRNTSRTSMGSRRGSLTQGQGRAQEQQPPPQSCLSQAPSFGEKSPLRKKKSVVIISPKHDRTSSKGSIGCVDKENDGPRTSLSSDATLNAAIHNSHSSSTNNNNKNNNANTNRNDNNAGSPRSIIGPRPPSVGPGSRRGSLIGSPRTSPSGKGSRRRGLHPVSELVAEEMRWSGSGNGQRASADSLGLYDREGFLIATPDLERCLRM